jgi:hypothetical protein
MNYFVFTKANSIILRIERHGRYISLIKDTIYLQGLDPNKKKLHELK